MISARCTRETLEDLLYNKVLIVSDFKKDGDVKTLGVLERLRTHHVQVTDSKGGRHMESGTGEMHKGKPLTVDQLEPIVKDLKAIEQFDHSNREEDFRRVRKEIDATSEKAKKPTMH